MTKIGPQVDIHIELDSRIICREDFAQLVLSWISATGKLLGLDPERPPAGGMLPFAVPALPSGFWPFGEPTALAAGIYVQLLPQRRPGRGARCATGSWRKLSDSLREENPYQVSLHLTPVRGSGALAGRGKPAVLSVTREPAAPEWVRFEAHLPEGIVAWRGTAGGEAAWLQFIRDWVSGVPTSYGHIASDANSFSTSHEASAGRKAWDTVPYCEERLRGWSWVTVCASRLTEKLGGLETLAASGAFVEVTAVAGGSLFLRATETMEEYDKTSAAKVFSALVPVLFG
jgi:hypothetical protein